MKFSELDKPTQVILQVILAVLILLFLWEVRGIVLLLLLALILASAMEPIVAYLHKKKVPRVVSVVTVYLLVIGAVALVIYLIIPPVAMQFKILQTNLPAYNAFLQTHLTWLFGGGNINDAVQQLISSGGPGRNVISNTFGAFNGFLDFIAVLVIAFYLVAEEAGMQSFVSSIIPIGSRPFTLQLVKKIQDKMGMWLLGQIIVSLGIFIFTYVGLLILHVQFALVLALVAGMLEIVPYIGPFLSAVPAIFMAFVQSPGHPSLIIAVIILYLLVHEVEGYVLVPKIMEKTVGTSPLVVMIALLVGYQLAGILGLLISVPIAAAITVTVNEFWPAKPV